MEAWVGIICGACITTTGAITVALIQRKKSDGKPDAGPSLADHDGGLTAQRTARAFEELSATLRLIADRLGAIERLCRTNAEHSARAALDLHRIERNYDPLGGGLGPVGGSGSGVGGGGQ